ncbi:WW domain [Phytophthora cactorum]|nr:WW domain [Phytophthora cactorum]
MDRLVLLQETLRAIETGQRLESVDGVLVRQVLQQHRTQLQQSAPEPDTKDLYRELLALRKNKANAKKNAQRTDESGNSAATRSVQGVSPKKLTSENVDTRLESAPSSPERVHISNNDKTIAETLAANTEETIDLMQTALVAREKELRRSEKAVARADAELREELVRAKKILPSKFLFKRNLASDRQLEAARNVLTRFQHRFFKLFFRRWWGITLTLRLQAQCRAVTTIIRVYRGHQGRREAQRLRRELSAMQAQKRQLLAFRIKYRSSQAVKLQMAWRRYLRLRAIKYRQARQAAAILLQRAFPVRGCELQKLYRGYRARRKLRESRQRQRQEERVQLALLRSMSKQARAVWMIERRGAGYLIAQRAVFPYAMRMRWHRLLGQLRRQRAAKCIAKAVCKWFGVEARREAVRGKQVNEWMELVQREHERSRCAAVLIQKHLRRWVQQRKFLMAQARRKKIARRTRLAEKTRRMEQTLGFCDQSLRLCRQHKADELVAQSLSFSLEDALRPLLSETTRSPTRSKTSPTKQKAVASNSGKRHSNVVAFPVLQMMFLMASGWKMPFVWRELDGKTLFQTKLERTKAVKFFRSLTKQGNPVAHQIQQSPAVETGTSLSPTRRNKKPVTKGAKGVETFSSVDVDVAVARATGGAKGALDFASFVRVIGLLGEISLTQQSQSPYWGRFDVVLQTQARELLARRELRRRMQETYEKFLDPTWGLPYWMNPRSAYSTWQKPRILGAEDVQCEPVPFPLLNDCDRCAEWVCYDCDEFFCLQCFGEYHKVKIVANPVEDSKDDSVPKAESIETLNDSKEDDNTLSSIKREHELERLLLCGLCKFQLASRRCLDCIPKLKIKSKPKLPPSVNQQKEIKTVESASNEDQEHLSSESLFCDVCFGFLHRRGGLQTHRTEPLLELCTSCIPDDQDDKHTASHQQPPAVFGVRGAHVATHLVESVDVVRFSLIQRKVVANFDRCHYKRWADNSEPSVFAKNKKLEITFWRSQAPILRARRLVVARRKETSEQWLRRQEDARKRRKADEEEDVVEDIPVAMFLVEFSLDPRRTVWINHSLAERFWEWKRLKLLARSERVARRERAKDYEKQQKENEDKRKQEEELKRQEDAVNAANFREPTVGDEALIASIKHYTWSQPAERWVANETPTDPYYNYNYYPSANPAEALAAWTGYDGYSTAYITGYGYDYGNGSTTLDTSPALDGGAAGLVDSGDYYANAGYAGDMGASNWYGTEYSTYNMSGYSPAPTDYTYNDSNNPNGWDSYSAYDSATGYTESQPSVDPSVAWYANGGDPNYNSTEQWQQNYYSQVQEQVQALDNYPNGESSSPYDVNGSSYSIELSSAADGYNYPYTSNETSTTAAQWEEVFDPTTQQTYYVNRVTNETAWQIPS